MILHVNYEELTALQSGARVLLDREHVDWPEAFENRALRRAGFDYDFPAELVGPTLDVRVFAVSNSGVASELGYPRGYR